MITLNTPRDLMTTERTAKVLNCEDRPALAGIGKSSHFDHVSVPPQWAVAGSLAIADAIDNR